MESVVHCEPELVPPQLTAVKPARKRHQKADQRFSLQSELEMPKVSQENYYLARSTTTGILPNFETLFPQDGPSSPTPTPSVTSSTTTIAIESLTPIASSPIPYPTSDELYPISLESMSSVLSPIPTTVAMFNDSLSAYTEKILLKSRRESMVICNDNLETDQANVASQVEQDDGGASHVYELIEVVRPNVNQLPPRPSRGCCKIVANQSNPEVVTQKPPTGKPKRMTDSPKVAPKFEPHMWSWSPNQSASLPPLTEETVERFFAQERQRDKSSTIGAYIRRFVTTAKPTQITFFQQLSKRMKESLGSFGRSSEVLIHEPPPPPRPVDPDWVFFRGFGGKSPVDIVDPYAIYDVPRPRAPPRRKRTSPKKLKCGRRSASMSDMHPDMVQICAQEPLYAVPKSTPIYAVVDKSAKLKYRLNKDQNSVGFSEDAVELILPRGSPGDLVELNEDTNTMHGHEAKESCLAECTQELSAPPSPPPPSPPTGDDESSTQTPQVSPMKGEQQHQHQQRVNQSLRGQQNDTNQFIQINEKNSPQLTPSSYHEEVAPTSEATRMHDPTREHFEDSSPFRVTPTFQSPHINGNNVWPTVNNDQPVFISPWNTNSKESIFTTNLQKSSVHPFARRAKSRYLEPPPSSSDEQVGDDHRDDSFDEILKIANKSIESAESILSSLRREEVMPPAKVYQTPSSPVTDIDSNIRRLEKAQDEINAALANFRTAQALNGILERKCPPPPPPPPKPSPQVLLTVRKRVAQFDSQKGKNESTLTHSQTAPNGLHKSGAGQNEEVSDMARPVRPARRHSFTNKGLEQGALESGDSNYDADVDSSSVTGSTSANAQDSSNLQDNGSSLSDSEGGGHPFRDRLKGIWGSFKKRRPEIPQTVKSVPKNNGSIYNCFGDYVSGATMTTNEEGTSELPAGLNPLVISSNSSASYHTPGSPPKQQSESGSSLSSFNPNFNRDSASSDESYEGEVQFKDSASSDTNPEVQGLTNPQKKKAFYVARELMTSERVFVDVLKLINVEFREFLQNARRESKTPIIQDTDVSKLFFNLPELQAINEDLLVDFENRVKNWGESQKIADVIAKKGPFLKLYNNYIRDFSKLNDHFEDCCKNNPKFKRLVQEFESKERCRNLKLQHYMLKPVQRLPQYRLLLEDYLKHLDEDGEDFNDTVDALRIVAEVAEQADNTIKHGENFRRMLKLQDQLGDFELIKPGRHLIKEGELRKISRKVDNPRYFILMSDCLLYTAYAGSATSGQPSLKVSYKIPLTSLEVKASNNVEEFQTEFSITSPIRSCTLKAGSVRERNEWLDALHTAIEDHENRKRTFKEQNNKMPVAEINSNAKPGDNAPIWIPDSRVTMCQKCATEFTVLVRRHHCRACGQVVCSTCSSNKAPLKYRKYSPAKVCDTCYDILEKELSHNSELFSKFQKRDPSQIRVERFVPNRLRESGRGEGAQMRGYLKRKTRSSKSWKRMWFVLKDRAIYIYKAPEDNVAVEAIPILGYILDLRAENGGGDLMENEGSSLIFKLSHPGSEGLLFAAETQEIKEKWITALKEAVTLESSNQS